MSITFFFSDSNSHLIHLHLLVDILYLDYWYMYRISYIPSQYFGIVFPPIFSSSFLFFFTYSVCFFPFFITFFFILVYLSLFVLHSSSHHSSFLCFFLFTDHPLNYFYYAVLLLDDIPHFIPFSL